MIVAIDGPAGAGKSTVARMVAARLGFAFLDTGALYRCAVLLGLRSDMPPEHASAVMDVRLGERILLMGDDVTDAIRDPHITALTPAAAARPELRSALTAKQRELMAHGDWVAEGRDIGTVVAPEAELKVFLTADVETRARRRSAQTGEDFERVRDALLQRDKHDMMRDHSPLHAAPDAVDLDTTHMSLEDAVEAIVALVPETYTLAPALFAVTPEGVAPPSRRRRRRIATG